MKFGVTMFMTDQTIGPVDLAREVEARGLHSLYMPEHTHIPTSRRTPAADRRRRAARGVQAHARPVRRAGDGGGGDRAPRRRHRHLPGRPARSDRHRQGGRDASISESNGRFVFGIGFGWNADEIESHGVDMKRRRDIAREHMLAMKALWRDDVASFDGEFVHLAPSWSWPKPARRAGPPVLIGGAPGPKLFAHVAEYADGWIPIGGAGVRAAMADLGACVRSARPRPEDAAHRAVRHRARRGQARVLRVDRDRRGRAAPSRRHARRRAAPPRPAGRARRR